MRELYFTQTKLSAMGKTGMIKPDAEGYYELVVAGLEAHNNSGSWYYTKDSIQLLMDKSTIFQRRLASGNLTGEANHPKQAPGESRNAFAQRYMDIDLKNVAAHFKAVWFDLEFGKNHPEMGNPNLIAVMAKVKPFGPMGKYLEEQLQTQAQNTCFSMRGLAMETVVNGKVLRILQDLYAIDWVNEPGMSMATKWNSPACESMSSSDAMRLTQDLIERIARQSSPLVAETSREAAANILERFYAPKEVKEPVFSRWSK